MRTRQSDLPAASGIRMPDTNPHSAQMPAANIIRARPSFEVSGPVAAGLRDHSSPDTHRLSTPMLAKIHSPMVEIKRETEGFPRSLPVMKGLLLTFTTRQSTPGPVRVNTRLGAGGSPDHFCVTLRMAYSLANL